MGYMTAREFAHHVETGYFALEAALDWHFSGNCYPPVPRSMVPAAVRAIAKVKAGNGHLRVRLPEGMTFMGKKLAPASAVVDNFHLEAFCEE